MANQNIFPHYTVAMENENSNLVILDQTLLPGTTRYRELKTQPEIREAICRLQVRGAPAIGVAAAYGAFMAAREIRADNGAKFLDCFLQAKEYLAGARPTAVNLRWALDRMEARARAEMGRSAGEIRAALYAEALAIHKEDIEVCRRIGEYGRAFIHEGIGILTHCNAGMLATAGSGTALAPVYLAHEQGCRLRVFAGETRPLLQGARLTAYELHAAGVDTTLICDNMVSAVMQNGWVQAVFVGCDRVAANGDAANKIGTSGIAILAKYYGLPFYVFAPTATIDPDCPRGDTIQIEERGPEEVTEMGFQRRVAPEGIKVYNPAFDVTPAANISAIVTEFGVARAPYEVSLRAILGLRAR